MHNETRITGSKRSAERLTGFMLAASVFLMLAHTAADLALGHGRVSAGLILLYGITAGLAGSALYITFRRHDPTLAMFSGYCFAGHGLLIVVTAVILLAGLEFPGDFALYGAQPSILSGAASLPELVMDRIGKSAFVFLGLGFSQIGLVILLSGALPRWIGWLGVVVGTFGFLASLALLTDIFVPGTTELLMGVSGLLNLFVMSTLGLHLIFSETQEVREGQV